MSTPKPPLAVGVELVQDISAISAPVSGYMRRHRHRVKTRLSDGTRTDTYVCDFIDRDPEHRDAVVVVPYEREGPKVLLRAQVRYAAYLVVKSPLTIELVAGLLEPGETPEQCAAREMWEEAGLEVDAAQVKPLGRPFFPLPGVFTERIWPTVVEVPKGVLEASLDLAAAGDGSPFEEGAEQLVVTLDEAFEMMDRPPPIEGGTERYIADAKTELCLHRLRALLEGARR